MGLLDDAIREHLDLKRRRGADPTEIAREESEALGPVRREAPADDAPPPVDEGPYADHADHEPPALDEPAAAYDDEPAAAYDDEPGAVRMRYDDEEPRDDAPVAPPEAADPFVHQPTREFSATELGDALGQESARDAPAPPEDVVPADDDEADDPAAEDELEETPDFLQETPEHDRLWFEQKPPKDFDF